jgi:hypothetical protein
LLNAGTAAVFFVEEVERRQADVGDFFLTKDERLVRLEARFLRSIQSRHGRC